MPAPPVETLHHSFGPVVRDDTKLLVCGSLPGAKSLAARRYYAHPQNQFWRLMGAVIERDLPALDYEGRLAALLDHHIGLWDVVASANRTGSLDGAIRNHSAHDIVGLTRRLTDIAAVAFNGKKAAAIGGRLFEGESRVALVALPSSSPAYTIPFEAKLQQWLKLRTFLTRP